MQILRKRSLRAWGPVVKALWVALPTAVLLNFGACADGDTRDRNPCDQNFEACEEPEDRSVCGNGRIEGDELCDGAKLNGESCKSLGDGLYSGGTLLCSSKCTFDVSQCTGNASEDCGDGVDNDDNGLVDCDDATCSQDVACLAGSGGQPGAAGGGGAPQGTAGAGDAGTGGASTPSDGGAPQGVAGAGEAGAGGGGGESSGSTDKLIYRTALPKKANFGGISGADALCNASPPVPGTFKALLVDGTTRRACTTAGCGGGVAEHIDWVLAPDTAYARPDGTRIGTTNSAGVFVFPLQASIAFGYTYWTGLSADWTSNSDDCSHWTQTTGYFANEGNGDALTADAISGVNESCASLAGAFFVCVEQ